MNKEQLIDRVLELLTSRRFGQWYGDGGKFDNWIQGTEDCPSEEDIKKDLEKMLGL